MENNYCFLRKYLGAISKRFSPHCYVPNSVFTIFIVSNRAVGIWVARASFNWQKINFFKIKRGGADPALLLLFEPPKIFRPSVGIIKQHGTGRAVSSNRIGLHRRATR